ncbi:MAG: aminotransferase class V-fold PLP-dependent enzyme [Candidatus Heimdallarchaeota archaeon]|nr:MAG: aminotransferase class V-fold PLP-dependent enzyme [Candidatus Heimdallarchaeota archaeon]
MIVKDLSDDFPMIRKVNYLSTASIGLVPNPVIETTKNFFTEMARKGTLALDEEKEVKIYENLRKEGSQLLNCNPKDIAVFNSVSEALNSVAWSLELKEGKLVSTEIEFPSVSYPLFRIAENENITVKLVKADNWTISLDEILAEIDETTKAVFITHVEFLTGQQHDLKKITDQAHDFGSLVVVDGIQAAGYLPIDVRKLGIDVYITGSYKWLLAPFGTAIAYISKDLYEALTPTFVGWRSSEDMWDFNPLELKFPPTAMKFEYSTSAYGVKIGLAEAIKYLHEIGINNIYHHNMKLSELLINELKSIENVRIITPEKKASIVTFKIKDVDLRKIGEELRKLKRPIELNIRQNMIRISLHVYNTEEDVLQLIENLKKLFKRRNA